MSCCIQFNLTVLCGSFRIYWELQLLDMQKHLGSEFIDGTWEVNSSVRKRLATG